MLAAVRAGRKTMTSCRLPLNSALQQEPTGTGSSGSARGGRCSRTNKVHRPRGCPRYRCSLARPAICSACRKTHRSFCKSSVCGLSRYAAPPKPMPWRKAFAPGRSPARRNGAGSSSTPSSPTLFIGAAALSWRFGACPIPFTQRLGPAKSGCGQWNLSCCQALRKPGFHPSHTAASVSRAGSVCTSNMRPSAVAAP